jgi:hypothetical protein
MKGKNQTPALLTATKTELYILVQRNGKPQQRPAIPPKGLPKSPAFYAN